MKKHNTLTPDELNAVIRNITDEKTGKPLQAPTSWQRIDCGNIEVYVGDRSYVVALVDELLKTEQEIANKQINTESIVTKYLQSEGFIDAEYAYVGMQQFSINLPKDKDTE